MKKRNGKTGMWRCRFWVCAATERQNLFALDMIYVVLLVMTFAKVVKCVQPLLTVPLNIPRRQRAAPGAKF